MGTWGPGVFESDSALEFLDDAKETLVHEIVFLLADEVWNDLPADAWDQVVAAADILALWCEHYKTLPNVSKKVVRQWRNVYLQRFDQDKGWDNEDRTKASEARTARRKVIEATFARLEAIALDD